MGLLQYVGDLSSKDIYQVLSALNGRLTDWATARGIATWLVFALGLAVSVILGFVGYRLIKLVMGLSFGMIGYVVGKALFAFLAEKWEWLPAWCVYVLGAAVALVFLCLAFAKFSYAMFVSFALAGYCVTLFYTGNTALALGGGILLAMLSVFMVRIVFIPTCSFLCGFLSISFLSQLLSKVESLQLKDGNRLSLCCAIGLSVIFAVFQFVKNRKYKEEWIEE